MYDKNFSYHNCHLACNSCFSFAAVHLSHLIFAAGFGGFFFMPQKPFHRRTVKGFDLSFPRVALAGA